KEPQRRRAATRSNTQTLPHIRYLSVQAPATQGTRRKTRPTTGESKTKTSSQRTRSKSRESNRKSCMPKTVRKICNKNAGHNLTSDCADRNWSTLIRTARFLFLIL